MWSFYEVKVLRPPIFLACNPLALGHHCDTVLIHDYSLVGISKPIFLALYYQQKQKWAESLFSDYPLQPPPKDKASQYLVKAMDHFS